MLEVRRKPSESSSALLHRFSKIVKQSGILRESKKRRYRNRPIGKTKRKISAIRRAARKGEYQKKRCVCVWVVFLKNLFFFFLKNKKIEKRGSNKPAELTEEEVMEILIRE